MNAYECRQVGVDDRDPGRSWATADRRPARQRTDMQPTAENADARLL
ncbi:hypothetical protein ACFQZ4_17185 [Catellatospora coxensis]